MIQAGQAGVARGWPLVTPGARDEGNRQLLQDVVLERHHWCRSKSLSKASSTSLLLLDAAAAGETKTGLQQKQKLTRFGQAKQNNLLVVASRRLY